MENVVVRGCTMTTWACFVPGRVPRPRPRPGSSPEALEVVLAVLDILPLLSEDVLGLMAREGVGKGLGEGDGENVVEDGDKVKLVEDGDGVRG